MTPNNALRLVNKEALRAVGRLYRDFKQLRRLGFGAALARAARSSIKIDFRNDMMFPIDGNQESLKKSLGLVLIPHLDHYPNPTKCLQHLQHLALRLFDFARWPTPEVAAQYPSPPAANPDHTPWFADDFLHLLGGTPNLKTFHIVVDRLFSASFDAAPHAATRPSERLVSSPSQLRDVVKSLPRDKYGFSDYDAYARSTKLDIAFPRWCHPPDASRPYVLSFEQYDAYFQQVLSLVRTYSSPPLRENGSIETRLVVDLDSNLNRREAGQVMMKQKALKFGLDPNNEEELVNGYDRHFARPGAQEWYADVS
ncbi:hypothetical protein PG993_012526 [Apiospora rasikravindrae]|uniref:Uncharacterized protein n=1 Tax=Apiospora rasikravindrae TaxID=990691 RepID=A0ABR1S2V0_9PEZI